MYWKHELCDRPSHRTIRKFAFLPKLCQHGHKHWLETVEVNQRWINDSYSDVDNRYDYNPWGDHARPCVCPLKNTPTTD